MLKRVKRRYLSLAIDSQQLFSSREFLDGVWDSVLRLYGEHGCSTVSLSLIGYDDKKQACVLRTGHVSLDMVRAALASITKISGKPAAVHVLKVSGTLKGLSDGS